MDADDGMETECEHADGMTTIHLKIEQTLSQKETEVLSLIIQNEEANAAISVLNEQVDSALTEMLPDEHVLSENQLVEGEVTEPQDDDEEGVEMKEDVNMEEATLELNAADAAWISLLNKFEYVNEGRIRGHVEGEKAFLTLWESFQTSTMTSFSVRSSDRFYKFADGSQEGAVLGRILKGTPRWSRLPLVPFDGVPFVTVDRKYFGCRLGGIERRNSKKGQCKSSRNGQTVKVGCTAEAEVLEVWRVPELVLSDQIASQREKRRVKQKLLTQVREHIALGKFTRRYYVTLPLISKHVNHPVLDPQAGRLKILHPKIIEKIYDLVNEGIYEKRVIKYMLNEFVQEFQNELGIEIQSSDRAFHPTDRDINNHVRNARKAVSNSINLSMVDANTDAAGDRAIPDVVSDETLTYSTEVVATSFPEIITGDVVTYDINTTEPANIYENVTVATSEYTADNVVETAVDTSAYENTPDESSNYLTTSDVNSVSIDDIVHNSVIEYYQNANTEVADSVRVLPYPCKRKPVKRERKEAAKAAKLNKQRDLKILLREEIQKSFAVMNVALQEESDETKLNTILKKVKTLQRMVEGRNTYKRRERRLGVHSMVDPRPTDVVP